MSSIVCFVCATLLGIIMMGEGAKYLVENGYVKPNSQPFPEDTWARVILVWLMTGMFAGVIMFNYYVLKVISLLLFGV